MEAVSPDHPRLNLLFAIEGDVSDDDADAMEAAVKELQRGRTWALGPPEYVDEEDVDEADDLEDAPILTVGGVIKLYSSYPPWGEKLPTSVDRAQYHDVIAIVDRMSTLSRAHDLTIVVEYNGEPIGYIEKGVPDTSLTDGLLGRWHSDLIRREAGLASPLGPPADVEPNAFLLDEAFGSADSKYLIRNSRYMILNGQVVLKAPDRSGMASLRPWHQIVFLNADGQRTISGFMDDVAYAPHGSLPPGGWKEAREAICELEAAGYIKVIAESRELPYYLSLPIEQQDNKRALSLMSADGFVEQPGE